MSYSREQVSVAMNRAADDVLEAIDAPDEGTRDAVNLVVNAAMTYLEKPGATLTDAITENYSIEPGEEGPIEWAQR